jgi:hypothetical protein
MSVDETRHPVTVCGLMRRPAVNAFIRALTTVTFIAAWSIAPWLYESLQPVYAQPHEGSTHHRRPADNQQYLENLDLAERDTDQKPDKEV